MIFGKVVKSDQEQAVASWVNYLNMERTARLMEKLQQQDTNWEHAIDTLKDSLKVIDKEIIERNRGGVKGMHGFISEVSECGIGNAREQIIGKKPIYEWIDDNGPSDVIKNGVEYQMKFVQSGNNLSLKAIEHHLEKYPNYLIEGHKYQIPKDYYDKIKYYLSIPEEQANKMPTSTGDFSLKQWRKVNDFFKNGKIKPSDIEPAKLKYDEVQKGKIHHTYKGEEKSLKEKDQEIRDKAQEESKPSLEQGVKVAAVSAGVEGGMALVSSIAQKRREGKKFSEFDSKDWEYIAKETGKGAGKGAIRGAVIYGLTNYTKTPAAVASALCTASFGVAEQAYRLRKGEITQDEFIKNSEILCLDVSVSALSSFLGQTLIPVPVLGAVIGNTIGTTLYQISKEVLSSEERRIIRQYYEHLNKLDKELDKRNKELINELNDGLKRYYKLLEKAFSPNYEEALYGSVALANAYGLPTDELVTSIEEIDEYFLN